MDKIELVSLIEKIQTLYKLRLISSKQLVEEITKVKSKMLEVGDAHYFIVIDDEIVEASYNALNPLHTLIKIHTTR